MPLEALGVSADAAKLALKRMIREKEITSPAPGFYVIVPLKYRTLGWLPADQFIPALMEWFGLSYAGILSAAPHHGVARHRFQELQVMSANALPTCWCRVSTRRAA